MKTTHLFLLLVFTFTLNSAQARVYKNIKAGSYESSIDLADHVGRPFFQVMKNIIYPEMNSAAKNRTQSSHLDGIKEGNGVEVVLSRDVTTYHVKYKADHEDEVERSGRSFGAVGRGSVKMYVADASYKHYLRTLEKVLKSDNEEVQSFFLAILNVITNSDPSGISLLKRESKQVAADFVAIYIAEQYRRLTATKGKYLGKSHRWDDALMQVTLISAFHSGQDQMAMYYEGEFTDSVYNQSSCLYKAKDEEDRRDSTKKREAKLYDYWQFTVRSECPGRSGVNITRRDFEKLGRALTNEIVNHDGLLMDSMGIRSRSKGNFFKTVTEDLLEGSIDANMGENYASEIVNVLMELRAQANVFSNNILR